MQERFLPTITNQGLFMKPYLIPFLLIYKTLFTSIFSKKKKTKNKKRKKENKTSIIMFSMLIFKSKETEKF